MKYLLYAALAGLYLLHNDLFLWDDACLIYGFPSGLLYHIAYCIVTSVMMFLLVRFAWPAEVDTIQDQPK
jgi:hypothetical protein